MSKDYMIGGVSCRAIAEKLGTPVQIYDQERIEKRLAEYSQGFISDSFETGVLYASKAFLCGKVLEMVKEAGFSIDVVSGGELHMARTAGFPMERVYFHGNNKSLEELEMALDWGVGTVVLDNPMEAAVLTELADHRQKNIDVLVRINPGIEAHTHKYIMTAHLDSKFGMSIRQPEEFLSMVETIRKSPYVSFRGLHAHIGSQIFDREAFAEEVRILAGFAEYLEKEKGIPVDTLDLGGGFAALYTAEDKPIPISQVCETILKTAEEEKAARGIALARILIEPGRSLIAEAGSTLYTVGYSKKTDNKNYIFVDGGMSDNIRPALYEADYNCDIIDRLEEDKTVKTTVAGKCCESGDILIQEIMLPPAQRGDLLLVYTTGAYGYSMASNYNRLARPAVVFVKDGKAELALRRETFQDMEACEAGLSIDLNQ